MANFKMRLMRYFGIVFFYVILCTEHSLAQNFPTANQWWVPSQTYLKFRLAKTAIYRIYANQLNLPPTANPNFLHMFFKGKEIPIYVENSGNPAVLDGNDFIEFYGQKWDGEDDKNLYRHPFLNYVDPEQQPNVYFSLFTDTSAYFLTWDNQPGLRYQNFFETNYSNYPTQTHMLFTSRVDYTNNYYIGARGAYYNENTNYTTGEGYVGSIFNSTRNQSIPTPHRYTSSTNPVKAKIRITGVSEGQHNLRFEMGNVFTTYSTQNIYIQTVELQGSINDISSPNTNVKIIPSGLTYNGTPENNALCWISITYDRTFTLNGDSSLAFQWVNTAVGKSTFEFNGATINTNDEFILYDLSTYTRIVGTGSGSTVRFVVPKLNADTVKFFYSTSSGMGSLLDSTIIQTPHDYVNLSDPNAGAEFVIITNKRLLASAQEYATYRDTNTVNRFSTKVVVNEQIYDEFGYGCPTPLAIKRFVMTALQNWTIKPKYIFLWGKGLHDTRGTRRTQVLTWGQPACDFEFVSNFRMDTVDNLIHVPIGRINVNNDAQGRAYLEKIIEYEHTEFQPWMKNGLHLGGGQNANEQNAIRYYLEGVYEPIFEGSPFAGNIFYHQKSTGAVIGPNTIDIKNTINNGVSLITFFGHSSSNIYDIEIDSAHNYLNYSKYPFMIALGCYSGNFAIYGTSFGEHFTLEPKRGCIGYLSSSGAGYLTPLGEECRFFYEIAYRDSLGKALGNIIQEKFRRIVAAYPNNQTFTNHFKTTNLQCDPALRLYAPKLPDLAISQQDITFIPNDLTAQTSQFKIQVIIHNYGLALAPTDSFNLSIKQTILQTGQTLTHTLTRMGGIISVDTVIVDITIPSGVDMAGPNIFEIFVDAGLEITESNENNNIVRYEKFIYSKLPVCIFPTEFAVINKDTVVLKASTYSVTLNPTKYEFEIDTVWEFNSPMYRKSGIIQGTSFYAEWKVPYALTDSTVYYWRVRLPEEAEANNAYCLSSFKYIKGPKEGWAQSRPPQFFDNPTSKVSMDKIQRLWQFAPIKSRIRAEIARGGVRNLYQDGSWLTSLNLYGKMGVIYTIFNKNSLKPITFNLDYFYHEYLTYPNAPDQLASVIQNMRQGDYILIFFTGANGNSQIETWNASQMQALYSIGCSNQLQQLGKNRNFIVLGRKGAPMGSAIERFANDSIGVELEGFMYGNEYSGTITTKTIGPSNQWNDLIWDWYPLETANTDEIKVNLYGRNFQGQETLLLSNLSRGTYDLTNINAQTYPYLRLEAIVKDSLSRTAPQLDNWHVLYAPVPEALLDPTTIDYVFYKDTLHEGDSIEIALVARNITNIDMDSLLVRYQYKTALGDIVLMDTVRMKPLLGLSEYVLRKKLPTRILQSNGKYRSFTGLNYLVVTINPDFDQPEQYLFNNVYEKSFYVIEDKINPILDVTFDGKHITDGDIVSPKPEILIEVNDENQFLVLDDTTCVEIYLKKADQIAPPARIFFGSSNQLEFIPASKPENKAKIYFRPDRFEDGEYILYVQGFDKKLNLSGKVNYQIKFKVINESSITQIINYPNPFSTSTRFVYTLTGAEIPEVFKIQIFTISGKLVKEIDLLANHDVYIGNNITQTTWDGTDEYGDKLANGVYLYRVILKMPNDQNIRLIDDKTKKYFNNGYGKMVIMR